MPYLPYLWFWECLPRTLPEILGWGPQIPGLWREAARPVGPSSVLQGHSSPKYTQSNRLSASKTLVPAQGLPLPVDPGVLRSLFQHKPAPKTALFHLADLVSCGGLGGSAGPILRVIRSHTDLRPLLGPTILAPHTIAKLVCSPQSSSAQHMQRPWAQ